MTFTLTLCSHRNEEKHEKYSPSPGEEPPASRCFRCCDPGTPVYQAIPAPQINITILKGQVAAETGCLLEAAVCRWGGRLWNH